MVPVQQHTAATPCVMPTIVERSRRSAGNTWRGRRGMLQEQGHVSMSHKHVALLRMHGDEGATKAVR